MLGLVAMITACSSNPAPKENYPYGMTEREWNDLSIQDKAKIRRDFYFVEKGNMNFVNPDLQVDGKKEPTPNIYMREGKAKPAGHPAQ